MVIVNSSPVCNTQNNRFEISIVNTVLQEVAKSPEDTEINIIWDYTGDSDLFILRQVIKTLNIYNAQLKRNLSIIHFPYMQEHVYSKNNSELKNIINILNELRFYKIQVFDPINPDLLLGLDTGIGVDIYNMSELVISLQQKQYGVPDYLLFLSQEQANKYQHIGLDNKAIKPCKTLIYHKNTNSNTESFLNKPKSLKDKSVLVVTPVIDDYKFIGHISEKLYKAHCSDISLYVSHLDLDISNKYISESYFKNIFYGAEYQNALANIDFNKPLIKLFSLNEIQL